MPATQTATPVTYLSSSYRRNPAAEAIALSIEVGHEVRLNIKASEEFSIACILDENSATNERDVFFTGSCPDRPWRNWTVSLNVFED